MLFYLIQPIGFLMLLIGLVSCFFGYEIYKASIRITGFFIGAVIGLILTLFFRGGIEISFLLALIFGILGAIVAVQLNFILLFLEGGINGALITIGVLYLFNIPPADSLGIAVIGFIISGILVVAFTIGFTIISTSIFGAIAIMLGITFLFPRLFPAQSIIIVMIAILVISAAGMEVQFRRLKGRKKCPRCNSQIININMPCPSCWFLPAGKAAVEITCPNCHTVTNVQNKFCGRCGFSLEGLASQIQQSSSNSSYESQNNKIFCPNCHTLNELGSKYCMGCGYFLETVQNDIKRPTNLINNDPSPSEIVCSKCGFRNSSVSAYCGGCGARMKELAG